MATETKANGGEETTDKQIQEVQKVDKIVVDPDDVIKHFTKNRRLRQTLYDSRKFRLTGFRKDGVAEVKIGVDPRDDGGYYPENPHPIWLSPSTFIQGEGPGEEKGHHNDIGLPDEAENKRELRDDSTIEAEEGTKEFEKLHEEAMETWEEIWEQELRNDLKDEIELEMRTAGPAPDFREVAVSHTIEVEYQKNEA